MNWNSIKNNKAFQIGLIIVVPTAIVGAYLGYKYIKKKRDESNSRLSLNPDGTVDTTGMDYYKIYAPYNLEVGGKIYEAISKTPYVSVGDIVIDDKGTQVTVVEIMTKPEDAEKIRKILPIVGSDVKMEKITKEQSLTLPKEYTCTKKESTNQNLSLSNLNDFYEEAKCLEWNKMFGYDLIPLKDLPDIEKRITMDELDKILSYAKIGATKLTEEEAIDFMKLMAKAYSQ